VTAYVIIDIDIHDAAGFQKYRDDVPAIIAKHGGEYLVRGGEFEVIEGDWKPRRVALLRFPSRHAIRTFFADLEYTPLKALRSRHRR
jgi:uncharacterized protein (DUF1330 family)